VPRQREAEGFNCSAPWPDRGCVTLERVLSPSKNSIAYIDTNFHALSGVCPFNGTQVILGATPKLTWDLLEEIRKMTSNMSVVSLGSTLYEEVVGTPGRASSEGGGSTPDPSALRGVLLPVVARARLHRAR